MIQQLDGILTIQVRAVTKETTSLKILSDSQCLQARKAVIYLCFLVSVVFLIMSFCGLTLLRLVYSSRN